MGENTRSQRSEWKYWVKSVSHPTKLADYASFRIATLKEVITAYTKISQCTKCQNSGNRHHYHCPWNHSNNYNETFAQLGDIWRSWIGKVTKPVRLDIIFRKLGRMPNRVSPDLLKDFLQYIWKTMIRQKIIRKETSRQWFILQSILTRWYIFTMLIGRNRLIKFCDWKIKEGSNRPS